MKKKIILAILLLLLSSGIIFYYLETKKEPNQKSTTEDIDASVDTDDGDEDIVWSNYETKEITLSESITITEEGVYQLTGTISNGMITVQTEGNVKLVLNSVTITNQTGPAIYIESADNTLIYLEENTVNTFADGENYQNLEEDVNGVIYSKDDLIIDGTGTLNITANYEDGIVSKDDLKILNGSYQINASDEGIRGKDSVYIVDGNFEIEAKGDGIKSTNDTDTEKGFILIENGTFKITAGTDGIEAQTKLIIKKGNFEITTGGGAKIESTSSIWGGWNSKSNDTEASAKGLKAGDNIVITDGTFTFETSDDAIHSNNYVGLTNGNYTITSGDDGIHADEEIVIDGGNINITKSYEGIEASKVTINNGNIQVTATDDGINVAGGNDASATNRPGANPYGSSSSSVLTINGGTIYVNATGDGLDANGSIYINGGVITVDGPTNSGNGTLDYDREFVITNGTILGAGSSGMAQGFSSSSEQYGVLINLGNSYANKLVKIIDESGEVIVSYTPSKTFSSLIISTKAFQQGNTYAVEIDGSTITSFTISSISTTIGNGGGMSGAGMHGGGPQGRR